jgi:hypothetical protein
MDPGWEPRFQVKAICMINSICSDQLESLCSFDHYAPSLYQINLKLLIQNIIICKILYTVHFPCFVNSAVPE